MAVDLPTLVDRLQVYAPAGIDLPRDPETNQVDSGIIGLWAADGVGEINKRRGTTTVKEVQLTITAGTTLYTLPADCREIIRLDREQMDGSQKTNILDMPSNSFGGWMPTFGALPSGQEVSSSIDLIMRMRQERTKRENDWELIGTQIRLLFDPREGEPVTIRYRAIDRNLSSLTDDRFTLILLWCRIQVLDWWLVKRGLEGSILGEGPVPQMRQSVVLMKTQLMADWLLQLNSIFAEAA